MLFVRLRMHVIKLVDRTAFMKENMVYPREEKRSIATSCQQWTAAFGAFILMTQTGIQIGWVSPNLARLTLKNSTIPLTQSEASWMLSFGSLAGLGGAIFGSILVGYIGSKKTILVSLVLTSVSWACLIIANSFVLLYISRILSGVTCIISACCFSIFLGEISRPNNRGTLISIAMGGSPFGIVIGTIAETYLLMKISSSVYLAQCLMAIILFTWLQESPYHLVKTNNYEQARKSIAFYYAGCDVESELSGIKNFIETDSCQNIKDKLQEFRSPVVIKSMLLIIILFALPLVSGKINLLLYMETILISGKSHLIRPEEFVIYANIIFVVTSLLTVKLIDKLGRKILLIISSVGTAVALTCLGIYFYLFNFNIDVDRLQWLPLVTILVFLITYAIGFTPVPSTVLSEIFPQRSKSVAACIANMGASLFGFIFISGYQLLVDLLGQPYVFWIHAGLCLFITLCILYLLPETKGKTFQEIQNDLHNK